MAAFWRKCRTTFRWCRFCLWTVILLALLAFVWLDLIGLPDFLKTRLTATLRERGVQIEFTRMRLRPTHGLVAENVRVGEKGSDRPDFTVGEVQLLLNYPALWHRHLQLDGAVIRDGKFVLPVSPTNSLLVMNIQADMRFMTNQTWALDDLQADFDGTRVDMSGELEHAPELAHWKLFSGHKPAERGMLSQPLKDFADQLARIHLSGHPQIGLTLDGDARDIHTITLRLNGSVPGMDSPWFTAHNLQLAAHLTAPGDIPTNASPALDFWTNALPFRLTWAARATDLQSDKISGTALKCSGVWLAPNLSVGRASAILGDGKFDVAADLNVVTRSLTFTNNSDFDPHILAWLLPETNRPWLEQILWTRPPLLHVSGAITVPPWASRFRSWPEDILPNLHLGGDLACSNAVLRGATLDLLRTDFSFENSILTVRNLEFDQDRTRLAFDGQLSAVTKNFRASLRGNLAAENVKPFLTNTPAAKAASLIQMTEPLVFTVNAAGNLLQSQNVTATGHLCLTNFAVRGQTIESLDTELVCSNRVLSFLRAQAFRSLASQTLTADSITLDFNQHMIFFTNGFSTFEEMIIPRAIGPKTARTVEPYQFLAPATARVHGQFPLRDINSGRDLAGTDLTFEVIRGAPWRWTKLEATNVTGTIRWLGQYLVLTNITAGAYGGEAKGHAYFDFRPVNYGCDFNFTFTATNIDVHQLAVGLSGSKSNKLEGTLHCSATIVSGNSQTWKSWNGYGRGQLYDGLLWNIPIFGLISPVLNTIAPGLGNSRATDASVVFGMTNGVAYSDSLTIMTKTMRLQYSGTLDLQQNVNAYATAQLMRNTWVVGPVVSLVLWPVSKVFECRVTGQVSDPKIAPVIFPFHPWKRFEEMFTGPQTAPAVTSHK